MKNTLRSLVLLLAGAVMGLGVSHLFFAPAVAQTTAPMMSSMPMHGGTNDCPMMTNMMQHAHGDADRMMLRGMMNMHDQMSRMHLTGDADRDFLAMMIPHHQAAIEMAQAEVKYGKDSKVIALAKSIISAQQKEIDEMQAWLK